MKKGPTKAVEEAEAEKPPYVPTPIEKEAMEAYYASRGKRGPRLKVTKEKNVTRVLCPVFLKIKRNRRQRGTTLSCSPLIEVDYINALRATPVLQLSKISQRAAAGDRTSVPVALRLVAMDEDHLMAAARYVALNPVRARLVGRAQDWPWSSVRAHLEGRNDGLVQAAPFLSRVAGRFDDLLDNEPDAEKAAALRAAEGIGRPLGSPAFLDRVAGLMGRNPRPGKPGRKPKSAETIRN